MQGTRRTFSPLLLALLAVTSVQCLGQQAKSARPEKPTFDQIVKTLTAGGLSAAKLWSLIEGQPLNLTGYLVSASPRDRPVVLRFAVGAGTQEKADTFDVELKLVAPVTRGLYYNAETYFAGVVHLYKREPFVLYLSDGEVESKEPGPPSEPLLTIPPSASQRTKKSESRGDVRGESGGRDVVSSNVAWSIAKDGSIIAVSYSIHNRLRVPIRNVRSLVVLYDSRNSPVHSDEHTLREVVPPGLAKRAELSLYGASIFRFSVARTEVRVLDFEVVE